MVTADTGQPEFEDPTLQHIAETPGLTREVVRGLIALARNWREQEGESEEPHRRLLSVSHRPGWLQASSGACRP